MVLNDLKTIHNEVCQTFQEACHKRGSDCLRIAELLQMPSSSGKNLLCDNSSNL